MAIQFELSTVSDPTGFSRGGFTRSSKYDEYVAVIEQHLGQMLGSNAGRLAPVFPIEPTEFRDREGNCQAISTIAMGLLQALNNRLSDQLPTLTVFSVRRARTKTGQEALKVACIPLTATQAADRAEAGRKRAATRAANKAAGN